MLVVMLCLSLFVGCGKRQPKPEEGVEASNATSYETTTATDSDTIAAGLDTISTAGLENGTSAKTESASTADLESSTESGEESSVDKTEAATEVSIDTSTGVNLGGSSESGKVETEERSAKSSAEETADMPNAPPEDGTYTSKDDVALYIHTYGKLPSNFITKKEANALGWNGGALEKYAPGKSIGGDKFGNYEGLLPTAKGRKYYECDIDTLGKKRGAKRIIFSNDGLIYYTGDHYESFEQLY